jgi:hypothetical protein
MATQPALLAALTSVPAAAITLYQATILLAGRTTGDGATNAMD